MNAHTGTGLADPPFTIDCKDILLREFVAADLDAFHALTWQPEIYEFLPGWNVSRDQRAEWFINYEIPGNKQFFEAVSNGGEIGELYLRLGIVLKETGELIGWCCSGIKDELPPPNREIMYAISKDHRGKGYTTQAAEAVTRYLFEQTNTEVLHAVALVHNAPSNRVIQKSGFAFQGLVEIDNEPYNHYKIAKTDTRGLTTLYMVRHAESPFVFGQERERGLSEEGMNDARRIAELFADLDVHYMAASSYVRAVQTIQFLAENKELPIEEFEELVERPIKGLDYKSSWETLQEAIRRSFHDPEFALEGGESTGAAQRRAIPAIEQILEKWRGKSVVIGTHGNIMTIIMNYYDPGYGYDFWEGTSKPDVYRMTFDGNRLEQVERLWKPME